MSTRTEKLALLKGWLEAFQKIQATYDALNKQFGLAPESPVGTVLFAGHTLATKYLSAILRDEHEMLHWFLWENDCGKKGMAAKAGSWEKERPIKTLANLLDFIEAT